MPEFMEWVARVGVIVAGGTIVAAVIGAVSWARFIRQSVQTLLFMRYTERYEQIMAGFPEEALKFRFNMGTLPPQSAHLTLAILKYLNLCSEEYHLFQKGYIEKKVWEIWEVELQRMLTTPLVVREWQTLRTEFQSYQDFQKYVEALQARGPQPETARQTGESIRAPASQP